MVVRHKKDKLKCEYCEYKSDDIEILMRHEITLHGYHRNAPFRKNLNKVKPKPPKNEPLIAYGTMKSRDGFPVDVKYVWNQEIDAYDIYALLFDKQFLLVYSDEKMCFTIPDWSGAKVGLLHDKYDSERSNISYTT